MKLDAVIPLYLHSIKKDITNKDTRENCNLINYIPQSLIVSHPRGIRTSNYNAKDGIDTKDMDTLLILSSKTLVDEFMKHCKIT